MKAALLSNRFSLPGIQGKSDMDLAKVRKGCNKDAIGIACLHNRQTIKHREKFRKQSIHF